MGTWRSGLTALGLVMTAAAVLASSQGRAPLEETMRREAQPNPSLTAYQNGVRDEAHRRQLELRRFDANVTVRGAIAETVLDMRFAGLKGDQVEAWLHVDLPEGAIVTGYALDIDGQMSIVIEAHAERLPGSATGSVLGEMTQRMTEKGRT